MRSFSCRNRRGSAVHFGNCAENHKDAAHHCWAWRIGTVRIREKSSDGGEPQGTAGHPMLHVLQMKSLTNTLSAVTRYFGGIKLGTGGLARAYGGTGGSRGGSRYSLFYAPRPPGTYDSLYRGRHV
ncbi:MAG: IMPACT family protein [Dialister invisus]